MKSRFRALRLSLMTAIAIASLLRMPTLSSAQDASTPTSLPLVAPIFSSNMVLQRGMPDPIWGWTQPGALVRLRVTGASLDSHLSATAGADGKWTARLPQLAVGGPYEIAIVSPSGSADFTNVLSGDVWLCSGQSNMQFGVGVSDGGQEEIASANYPNIRLMLVHSSASDAPTPLARVAGWDVCTPQTLAQDGSWAGFSAVGWYFGKGLYQDLNIPIGLIGSYVGGTPAEAWTSADALGKNMPDIASTIPGLIAAQASATTERDRHNKSIPSVLFNAMVYPLIPYGIKGAIWYQGESNVGRGYAYRTLLPTMIGDWRSRWQEGDFPFLIVQIAGWQPTTSPGDDPVAEVREAQFLTAMHTPDCGIATAVDIGDPKTIHPTNKAEVGRRLDLLAQALVYHEKVICMGPTYKSMTVIGNSVQIDFRNAFGGLIQQNTGPIAGFQIAGADRNWYWANAQIYKKYSVLLSSPSVPHPIAVRYGWGDWLPLDLYSNALLPVFPFRTDNWKLLSQP